MPYLEVKDCKLYYRIDDYADPDGTARVTLDFIAWRG